MHQLKKVPHFLYLLPLFFVLHGYVENYPVVPWSNAAGLFLIYCLLALGLTGFFYVIIRSLQAAAVMSFALLSLHFFFGPLHDALKSVAPTLFLIKYSFLLPALFAAAIGLLLYFRRKKPPLRQFSRYLVFLLVVFVLIDLVTLGSKASRPEKRAMATLEWPPCDTCAKPDIYLLIADSYSGAVPLKEVFHFDNGPFEKELRKRGFHLVDSSKSNYNYTPFTMASMLSMQYLQGLEGHNKSLHDRNICYTQINSNPVTAYLEKQNYSFKNYSIFRFSNQLPSLSTTFYKTGVDLITANTLVERINRDIRYHTVTRLKIRSEIERLSFHHLKLNELAYQNTWNEAARSSQNPRFVYTHIEMPHYPYYYKKDGSPNALEDLDEGKQSDTAKYLGYLQYANQKYLQLIDHILSNAKTPPVILFMSDHAFREYPGDAVDHRYHFMNFNAVYLPGQQYSGFYTGMSTVNQFRVLFNTLFQQNIPLLKDSTSFLQE